MVKREGYKLKHSRLSSFVLAFCLGLGCPSLSGGIAAYSGSHTIQITDDIISVKNMDMGEPVDSVTTAATAGGANAWAVGAGSRADGNYAMALGVSSGAYGLNSIAMGRNATAGDGKDLTVGTDAIAIGTDSKAVKNTSIAIGKSAVASDRSATAVGNSSKAEKEYSTALGYENIAGGTRSVAVGYQNIVGGGSVTDPTDASALGVSNKAMALQSSAIGYGNTADGAHGSAIGSSNTTGALQASAIGYGNTASGSYATALGTQNTATGQESSAIGYNNIANGQMAAVIGSNSRAYGSYSVAIGMSVTTGNEADSTLGQNAVVIGSNAVVTGRNAIGIGTGNVVSGEKSAAIGDPDKVYGAGSYAIGNDIVIGQEGKETGKDTFVLGSSVETTANQSVVLGYNSTASEDNVVSVGNEASSGRRRIINVADGTKNSDAATYGQIVQSGQTFTLDANHSAEIKSNAGATLATISIKEGKAEEGDKGFVTGDTVYNIVEGSTIVVGDEDKHSLDIKWNGGDEVTRGENSSAYGYKANASGEKAVALGYGATASAQNSVALGSDSTATQANTVSVGSSSQQRRIVNVANGTANTDAATYGQIVQSGQTFTLNGDNLSANIQSNANQSLAKITIEKGSVESGNDGFVTGDTVYNAITNIVQGSSVVVGDEEAHSLDIKWNDGESVSRGVNSAAYGYKANASGSNSVALGYGANASGRNSVALGQGSVATADNTVSVGSADNQRKIVNVAAGTDTTDAVNFGQIGSISGDGNVIKASTTNNVAANLQALDNKIGKISGTNQYVSQDNSISDNLSALDAAIRDITIDSDKLVTYNSTKKQIDVGGAVDATQVNFANPDGSGRKLTGIAAGTADTDAVNMSQLGQVSKDGHIIKASTTNNVAQNLEALDTAIGSVDKDGNVIEKANSVSQNLGALDEKIGALDAGKTYTTIQSDATISDNLAKLDEALKHTSYLDLDHIRDVTKSDNASVSGEGAIALGDGSKGNGKDSISIGTGSTVNGDGSGAYGGGNQVHGDGSYAVGNNNTIGEEGKNNGKDTFVLGSDVTTTANNAVVLGKGSTATEDNVVSVGSPGNERRIVNVAPGINDTDAANVGQLKGLKTEFTEEASNVGAVSAALAGLHPLAYDPDDKFGFAVAAGAYRGHSALALGSFYQPNEDTMFSIGGSFAGSHNAWNAGISFKLGYGSAQGAALSRLALTKRVETLTKEKETLQKQVSYIWQQIVEIKKKIGE